MSFQAVKPFLKRHAAWLGALVAFLTTGGLFLFPDLFSFSQFIYWTDLARGSFFGKIFFVSAFVAAGLFAPITLFPVVGGVLFSFKNALLINMAATTLGALIPFWMARSWGRRWVERRLKGKWVKYDTALAAKGLKAVLLIRWMGLPPFTVANYALGLSKIRLRDYLVGTVVGVLPWTALITYSAGLIWQGAQIGGEKGFSEALQTAAGPLVAFSLLAFLAGSLQILKSRRKAALVNTDS